MKATLDYITKEKDSKHGGYFYYIFFLSEKGRYKTCAYPKMRNFKKWTQVLKMPKGTIIGDLVVKSQGLFNADFQPKILEIPRGYNSEGEEIGSNQLNLF